MSSQRALPENMENRERLKYASEFNYVTKNHTRKDVVVPNYFHNLSQGWFQAGDIIYVHTLNLDGTASTGIFEITSITSEDTKVVQIAPWRSTGKRLVNLPPKKPLEPVTAA